MYTVLVLVVFIIALAWWFIIFFNRKDLSEQPIQEPAWTDLINNLRKISQELKTKEQLDNYLLEVNDQVRSFETDYAFLVAFNSMIREIREKLKS